MYRISILILLAMTSVLACAPSTSSPAAGQPAPPAAAGATSSQGKTLAIAIRTEPTSLAAKALQTTGVTLNVTLRLFNAGLVLINDRGQAVPYLAESLPALNTDSWKVFDDGTMETTYQLKPNLTWHDGQPFTADDFVSAWQVYTNPVFGLSGAPPQALMDEVRAPDPQTLVIHWKEPYAFASALGTTSSRANLPALPRHLLASQLETLPTDAFLGMAFWTTGYVGAGPFKVDGWQPGTAIEASAFAGHALGRPKIDRLELRVIGDA